MDNCLDMIGVGFKPRWFEEFECTGAKPVGFLEIHAENYMVDGGPKRAMLDTLAERYPISCHGVGLSIGASAALDPTHLVRLRALQDRYKPVLYSEHLAWSSHGLNHYPDLLPLPYNPKTLDTVCRHVDQLQQSLGRQVLIENPSSYLAFEDATLSEAEFLDAMAQRTSCGLLFDVNNLQISAHNLGHSARALLDAFPLEHVREIHLAGHAEEHIDASHSLLIDNHGAPIVDSVWELYRETLRRIGPTPSLIERDNHLPPFNELLDEVQQAAAIMAGAQVPIAEAMA